jgi:predicted oxidoreductase
MELLMKLRDKHLECIQMMILDRYSRQTQTVSIARQLKTTKNTINVWKRDEVFKAEYEKQLDIYRNNFDDIRLADRKERVQVLSEMFDHIPEPRVALKLKVLEQIRVEVGDDRIKVEHTHELIGPNIPPRAESYAEWLQQNQQMEIANAELIEAV